MEQDIVGIHDYYLLCNWDAETHPHKIITMLAGKFVITISGKLRRLRIIIMAWN